MINKIIEVSQNIHKESKKGHTHFIINNPFILFSIKHNYFDYLVKNGNIIVGLRVIRKILNLNTKNR